ncbi:MAG: hypothetical protein ACK5RL_08900 [Acidimicrobiales bacterium]
MNLFRSEDTVYQWSQTNLDEGGGLLRPDQIDTLFASDTFRRRLDPAYFAHRREHARSMGAAMMAAGLTGPAFMRPRTDDWHE